MTVEEMTKKMSSAELSEWVAYDRVDPLPDPWYHTAFISALMANLWGDGKKQYSPEDFLPKCRRRKKSPAEQKLNWILFSKRKK